jgi:hydrogenase maturation protease
VADSPRRLVLCIGNPDRGDDGIGQLVAGMLYGRLPEDVVVAECDGGAAEVLDRIADADDAILVDAAVSGAPPGTVHRVDCLAGEVVPTTGVASSHGLGVAEAIALARTLGCLPRLCVIYAVEAKRLTPGGEVSREVVDAAREVAEHVRRHCEERSDDDFVSSATRNRLTLDAGQDGCPSGPSRTSGRHDEA